MQEEVQQLKELYKKMVSTSEILEKFYVILKKISNKIDNYIGDYPTFIEPVYLESNVQIGDDVLLGPNVYIGPNTIVGDFVEISNAIIFNNVIIGDNIKIEDCIILNDSKLKFGNYNIKNSIIEGSGSSINDLKITKL
jgi:NDP-sugar pyrophosphorylase family protein